MYILFEGEEEEKNKVVYLARDYIYIAPFSINKIKIFMIQKREREVVIYLLKYYYFCHFSSYIFFLFKKEEEEEIDCELDDDDSFGIIIDSLTL